ncbi:MAG: DNA-3-methyladenine glycosylase [Planctomycetota bacterium]|jgi:DNA-3-methyladenine glycosylase
MDTAAPRLLTFDLAPETMARRLLGQRLVRVVNGRRRSGVIVETEAYLGAEDRAAHTFGNRRTARNESMYLAGGHAYVYFIYGMHHCLNVVCGAEGEGVAVLIRALEPEEGLEGMRAARPKSRRDTDLCAGPGRLAAALEIDRTLDGEDLVSSRRLWIEAVRARSLPGSRIGCSARIGVDSAGKGPGEWATRPLRFYTLDSGCVSR